MSAVVTIRKDKKGTVTVYIHDADLEPEKGMRLDTGQHMHFKFPAPPLSIVHNDTAKPGGGDLPIDWSAFNSVDWPMTP